MNEGRTAFYPLALFFLLILLIPALNSCRNKLPEADILFLNGKIITVDKNFTIANALAIRGEKIIAVGSNQEVERHRGEQTQVIDLDGKTVIPGLIDAHAHPEQASLSELEDEIPNVSTINQLLEWIQQQASIKEKGEWIIHPKLFYTRLRDLRQPTLAELDQAAPHNPVFLNGSYGGLINSAAMRASGFENVEMQVTTGTGTSRRTSFIKPSEFRLLKLPPRKTVDSLTQVEALKTMFSNYNKYGITSIISGYGDLNNYNRYRELSRNEELTVRVSQNFRLPYNIKFSRETLIDSLRKFPVVTKKGDEWVRTGSLKIGLDGGILTGTAYLREPWGERAMEIYDVSNLEYRGNINYNHQELLEIATAACETEWALTVHCTGGGGVDRLLDVFEEVNKSYPLKDRNFSIIHGNFFTAEAMERMQKLGVIANVQPAWFYKDADAMNYILGDERIKTFHPYRSMIDNGVLLSGGSDHMVKLDANSSINPYNPFLGMWSMISRTTERGTIIRPQEAITREEALKMYTINNARATFEESIKGSLEPGKLADLSVITNDFLTCPENEIKDITSELTLVGGKTVYSSK